MASPVETNGSSKLNREVLLQAWARLSVYDRTASGLKRNFVWRRRVVITLALMATVASVLTGIIGQTTLAVILAIISITLPIVGSYLMNDIIQFTGTTYWIKCRYIAEMMRMNIFLYRMQAGDYAAGPLEKMDNLLNDKLIAVRTEVKLDENIARGRVPRGQEEITAAIEKANSFTPGDDGLSEIEVEKYLRWRLDNQREWYDNQINEDFARLKFFVRSAQGFLLIGALASALLGPYVIQVVTLVAVTNAIAVALTQWSNVSMVGKTYGIFQIALDLLGDQGASWDAFKNETEYQDPAKRAAETANLAQRVENVLLWERQEWYETALQAQSSGDKMILGDLTRLTQRAQDAKET